MDLGFFELPNALGGGMSVTVRQTLVVLVLLLLVGVAAFA